MNQTQQISAIWRHSKFTAGWWPIFWWAGDAKQPETLWVRYSQRPGLRPDLTGSVVR